MSSDQDKENSSSEAPDDATSNEESIDSADYYEQGNSKDTFDEKLEFSRPVPSVEKISEEMNLTKAVAYLGFGLAALAIVFILFFIRDLDKRVGGVDSALISLEETMAPLRKEVKDSLSQVNADINNIKEKIETSESRQAVIELKRALVAIQAMELSDSPKVKAKSGEVINSIQALLGEFDPSINGEDIMQSIQPTAGEVLIEQAPDLIDLPIVEGIPKSTLGNESHAEEPISEPALDDNTEVSSESTESEVVSETSEPALDDNTEVSSESTEPEVVSETSESLVKEPETLSEALADKGANVEEDEGNEEDEEDEGSEEDEEDEEDE